MTQAHLLGQASSASRRALPPPPRVVGKNLIPPPVSR